VPVNEKSSLASRTSGSFFMNGQENREIERQLIFKA
jgi:hypothetical protein